MKTLIVDDDVLDCKLLQGLLKGYGECSIATDGDAAIQFFEDSLEKQEPFDLVCLDILMPDIDGYDVLHTMRSLEQNAKAKQSCIVMITALGEQENKTKAFYESCDGYLIKPVEKKLLLEILNSLNLI
jgi:two-component system chemotaxis response regulator CheY